MPTPRFSLASVGRLNRCAPRSTINLARSFSTPGAKATTPEDLHTFGEQHITKGLSRIMPGIMTKGKGAWVTYDHDENKKMLDFTCGIAVTNLGHAHPKISQAAADQCMKIVHSQCSISMHEPYLHLIQKLLPHMPHPSLTSFFFTNSGSEAVEASIKIARQVTKKQNIISMQGAYHGRTFGAMALTKSKTIYSAGSAPLMPGVFGIPFPYWHQQNVDVSTPVETLTEHALYQLELVLAQQSAPSDTAAIIVEPVLGEGGYVPAPPEFLQGLRKICDKHHILLIVDEVQSGFCRTGTWFAVEESNIRPDILITAKGLANGFPLSGVITNEDISGKLKAGSMGGTYAGSAVSCAAACAVVDVMNEEKILDNVKARSIELFSALNGLKYDPALRPHILDVRGRGLMVGIEFASPAASAHKFSAHAASDLPPAQEHKPQPHSKHANSKGVKHPASMASRVARKCIDKGMLILTTSVYEVIRFIPPLNVTKEELKTGCDIFAESVREVVKEG